MKVKKKLTFINEYFTFIVLKNLIFILLETLKNSINKSCV